LSQLFKDTPLEVFLVYEFRIRKSRETEIYVSAHIASALQRNFTALRQH
jgi:hypothetical protein